MQAVLCSPSLSRVKQGQSLRDARYSTMVYYIRKHGPGPEHHTGWAFSWCSPWQCAGSLGYLTNLVPMGLPLPLLTKAKMLRTETRRPRTNRVLSHQQRKSSHPRSTAVSGSCSVLIEDTHIFSQEEIYTYVASNYPNVGEHPGSSSHADCMVKPMVSTCLHLPPQRVLPNLLTE